MDWKFIETCVKYSIETQKRLLAARVRDAVRLFADEELDKYMEAEAGTCEQRMEEVRKIQARYEEETKTYPERLTVTHGSLGTIRKEVADLKREIDTALDPEGAAVRREEPNLEAGPKKEVRARADARADRLRSIQSLLKRKNARLSAMEAEFAALSETYELKKLQVQRLELVLASVSAYLECGRRIVATKPVFPFRNSEKSLELYDKIVANETAVRTACGACAFDDSGLDQYLKALVDRLKATVEYIRTEVVAALILIKEQ